MSKLKCGNVTLPYETDINGLYIQGEKDTKKYVKNVLVSVTWDSKTLNWHIKLISNFKQAEDFIPHEFTLSINSATDDMREKLNEIMEILEQEDLLKYDTDESPKHKQVKKQYKI